MRADRGPGGAGLSRDEHVRRSVAHGAGHAEGGVCLAQGGQANKGDEAKRAGAVKVFALERAALRDN